MQFFFVSWAKQSCKQLCCGPRSISANCRYHRVNPAQHWHSAKVFYFCFRAPATWHTIGSIRLWFQTDCKFLFPATTTKKERERYRVSMCNLHFTHNRHLHVAFLYTYNVRALKHKQPKQCHGKDRYDFVSVHSTYRRDTKTKLKSLLIISIYLNTWLQLINAIVQIIYRQCTYSKEIMLLFFCMNKMCTYSHVKISK